MLEQGGGRIRQEAADPEMTQSLPQVEVRWKFGSSIWAICGICGFGGWAQLAVNTATCYAARTCVYPVCLLDMQEVTGSNPVSPTISSPFPSITYAKIYAPILRQVFPGGNFCIEFASGMLIGRKDASVIRSFLNNTSRLRFFGVPHF
jgi:hypothetical protein